MLFRAFAYSSLLESLQYLIISCLKGISLFKGVIFIINVCKGVIMFLS